MSGVINPADSPYSLGGLSREKVARSLASVGNLDILTSNVLALFCSVKCPGKLILQTYDLAITLRNAGVTVISGFHSPMEKECLALLLRGAQPVVVCPARSIERMRIPPEWKAPLADGRLLVLSPFSEKERRATAHTAQLRNQLVAALADQVFVAHAAPGGKTEQFCREILQAGKPVLTLDDPNNAPFIALGAKPFRPTDQASPWPTLQIQNVRPTS